MKSVLFFCTLLISCLLFAKESKHREEHAHEHGAGTLGIAFEGSKGKAEFKISSESIFGFEFEAKTEKQKKQRLEGLDKLATKFSEMVAFDNTLNCKFEKEKVAVQSESAKHSSTVAVFNIQCDKSPFSTDLTLNFQKYFKKIKDLDVTVLVDDVQKSVEVKKAGTVVRLSK